MHRFLLSILRLTLWDDRPLLIHTNVSRTSLQNLLDLNVVGTEATVELEVVGIVQEGASEREQQLL